MYDRKYVAALEDLIMDELLPMYLVGCRVTGIDPKSQQVMARLLEAKGQQLETPMLMKEWNEKSR